MVTPPHHPPTTPLSLTYTRATDARSAATMRCTLRSVKAASRTRRRSADQACVRSPLRHVTQARRIRSSCREVVRMCPSSTAQACPSSPLRHVTQARRIRSSSRRVLRMCSSREAHASPSSPLRHMTQALLKPAAACRPAFSFASRISADTITSWRARSNDILW